MQFLLYFSAHFLGPGFGAEYTRFKHKVVDADSRFFHAFSKVYRV